MSDTKTPKFGDRREDGLIYVRKTSKGYHLWLSPEAFKKHTRQDPPPPDPARPLFPIPRRGVGEPPGGLRFGDLRKDGFRFVRYVRRHGKLTEIWANPSIFESRFASPPPPDPTRPVAPVPIRRKKYSGPYRVGDKREDGFLFHAYRKRGEGIYPVFVSPSVFQRLRGYLPPEDAPVVAAKAKKSPALVEYLPYMPQLPVGERLYKYGDIDPRGTGCRFWGYKPSENPQGRATELWVSPIVWEREFDRDLYARALKELEPVKSTPIVQAPEAPFETAPEKELEAPEALADLKELQRTLAKAVREAKVPRGTHKRKASPMDSYYPPEEEEEAPTPEQIVEAEKAGFSIGEEV